jgi:2-keto-4-pentenoate hydratase/2-oxohepta-3-ene-1,7-dioic acid hydratase in catechol pathway
MRLLMFSMDGEERLGAVIGSDILDLSAMAISLLQLIDAGDEGLARARALMHAAGGDHAPRIPLAGARILPPLNPPRGNILAIGRNYAEHAAESARARDEDVTRPTVFTKAQTSIAGPYDDIPVDERVTTQVDWEAELGVVIGRTGRDIAPDRALAHVFGYTVVNDLSARDLQFGWGGQYFKGKSLDGFCPLGPWIVTADEIDDPQNLTLRLRVNGTIKQEASTADMIFPVAELIAQLSRGMTLPAGAVIATGTPSGVGFARKPPEFLQPGDVVEAEVEGIGTLRNRIVRAQP